MVLNKEYIKWRETKDKDSKYSPEENQRFREMHAQLVARFSKETKGKSEIETPNGAKSR